MRVSLSVSAYQGTCSKCTEYAPVIPFMIVVDDHAGTAEPLCQKCLFDIEGCASVIPMEPLAPGPAPRRKALKKNRRLSLAQEREVCEELGARTQPGSGNQSGAKGDGRKKGELRIEAKFTTANSFPLQLEDLAKIAGECGPGEKPVLVIDYQEPGTRRLRDRFGVIHFHDLKELLDDASQHRGPQRAHR
jgi:hypothetical protein